MRKANVMRTFLLSALAVLPLSAAVEGIVTNATTGKPQAGVPVVLVQPSEKGMQQLGTATSDASGAFKIDKDPQAGGPILLQSTYKKVTYSKMIAPGQPSKGVPVEVFEAGTGREGVGVDRHGILFEPTEGKIIIREFVFIDNKSKVTYFDPDNGTYSFWAPADANIDVSITTQGGMPVKRPAEKAGTANVFKIAYPMRPGQTQIELTYEVPKADPMTVSGNVLHKDGEARLIVPKGYALSGDGLEQFAPEPRTQSAIYGVKPGPFKVTISGKAEAVQEEDPGQPEVAAARPRIYTRLPWILGLAGAMLALGLYQLSKAK